MWDCIPYYFLLNSSLDFLYGLKIAHFHGSESAAFHSPIPLTPFSNISFDRNCLILWCLPPRIGSGVALSSSVLFRALFPLLQMWFVSEQTHPLFHEGLFIAQSYGSMYQNLDRKHSVSDAQKSVVAHKLDSRACCTLSNVVKKSNLEKCCIFYQCRTNNI